jgi:hypothetical protein
VKFRAAGRMPHATSLRELPWPTGILIRNNGPRNRDALKLACIKKAHPRVCLSRSGQIRTISVVVRLRLTPQVRSQIEDHSQIYATIFIAVGSFRMIPNSPFWLKRLRSGWSGSASQIMD